MSSPAPRRGPAPRPPVYGQSVYGQAPRPPAARPTAPAPEPVKFLTVAEICAAMRTSKMTVYRLIHSGELRAVRVGRSFRVPERSFNEYMRAAEFDPASSSTGEVV